VVTNPAFYMRSDSETKISGLYAEIATRGAFGSPQMSLAFNARVVVKNAARIERYFFILGE